MNARRRFRSRPFPALIAALGLFLLGNNYCVLAVLAGDARMACTATAADAGSVPACHRSVAASVPTGHGAATAGDEGTKRPTGKPSCCPAPVVTPAAPFLEKSDVALHVLPHAELAVSNVGVSPATFCIWHGHRPAPDGQPPTRLACAPLAARAPPLA